MDVLRLRKVTVRRGARLLLNDLDWEVGSGERWVVIGPNGAGKTTLLQIASTRLFPTSGTVDVLGARLGRTDIAELKPLIGWASSAMAQDIPPGESVGNVVLTGAWAVSGRWREVYDAVDEHRAGRLLGEWGLTALASRTFATLSEGERKRALIARALMANPELLLLDEPGAALDLGGREDLVARLAALATDRAAPAQVLVTHHVEEIPPGFTHALLLRQGSIVASGPLEQVITGQHLSAAFDQRIAVLRHGERFAATRAP